MTLSELTHATVADCDKAAAEAEAAYREELRLQRCISRDTLNRRNALARKRHADRLKKIKAYRAVLAAEQPEDTTDGD